MTESVRRLDYFAVNVAHQPGEGARLLEALADLGVNFHAFTGFPGDGDHAQLDFVPEDSEAFLEAARQADLEPRGPTSVFLIQGEDRKGAVARVVKRLADQRINITAIDAVASGEGRYGAILWVKPEDVERAAKALKAE